MCNLEHTCTACIAQVYERGVEAVAMSVDMWLHYIKFATATDPENEERIRR